MTDNNRQNRSYSNIDLEETIQFTQEDLSRLRRPNRQPIDGDYFTEQISGNERPVEANESQQNSGFNAKPKDSYGEAAIEHQETGNDFYPKQNRQLNSNAERPKEFQSYPNETVIEDYPDFSTQDYHHSNTGNTEDNTEASSNEQFNFNEVNYQQPQIDDSYPIEPDEVVIDSDIDFKESTTTDDQFEAAKKANHHDSSEEPEENPFVYKSKTQKLRDQYEAEKAREQQAIYERREKLIKKFEDTYEPVYDENNLSTFDQYNQFEQDRAMATEETLSSSSIKTNKEQQVVQSADNQVNMEQSPVSELSFTGFLGHIKDSIAHKFSQKDEELSQLNEATEENERRALQSQNQRITQQTKINRSSEKGGPFESDSQVTASVASNPSKDSFDDNKANDTEDIKASHTDETSTHTDETSTHTGEQVITSEDRTAQDESSQNSEPIQLDHEATTVEGSGVDEQNFATSNGEATVKSKNDLVGKVLADTSTENIEAVSEQIAQQTQSFEGPILTDSVLDEKIVNDDLVENDVQEEEASFVKGTAWLTAGNIISRILGALYVIPWGTWFGTSYTTANVLYGIGYNPYALFLAISTAGFPSAIAKQMAYYHSQKKYKSADKIFKNSLLVMLVSGLVSGGLLFILAPFIAGISSTDNPQAAVVVIRSLAPALLILPVMSLLRGYFQGFGDMVPTAVSQILEQIARVVYMLAATYAIMKMLDGDVTKAVAHSTFAAFVGAVLSLVYLVFLYIQRRGAINLLIETAEEDDANTLDFKASLMILLKDSIPFILLGSGIIIAKFIDQITFKFILERTSTMLLSDISELFGVMNLDVDKLIMIIISIAVGMSLSSIPLITKLYANHEEGKTAELIEKISILFLLVMAPAAFGMASIANNMYQLFYPYGHEAGPSLLVTASVLSIILGAYTILSTIIQSMNYRRAAIRFLLVGLAVKLTLQFPLVAWLNAHGALIATLLGFLVTCILTIWKLNELVHLDFKGMLPNIIIIYSATLLMTVSAWLWNSSLDLLFGPVGRILTFVKILIVVTFAAFVYFGVLALFGKLSLLIGERHRALQDKLRMF
ncbi:oligosaccharide flippase family protein [Globicatella sanguinis]|uniref:oligosaccharide flippase family protein n=1 Tax=Globicatella sanguinis TaxID=13076 RepID=UPI0008245B9C|nr:oligosaccharide flippase family protein [Globicatella sanguinis]